MTMEAGPQTATFRQFARILGNVSPGYITELKAAGRLVLTEDGKRVLVEASRQRIRETASPAHAAVAARHAEVRASNDDDGNPDGSGASGSSEVVDEGGFATRRAKAQAQFEEARARKALREEQLEIGQLLRVEDVREAMQGAATIFRHGCESLAPTLAAMVAPVADEAKCRVIIAEEVENLLGELSRSLAKFSKGESK